MHGNNTLEIRPDELTRGPGALCRAQEYHCNLALFFFWIVKVHKFMWIKHFGPLTWLKYLKGNKGKWISPIHDIKTCQKLDVRMDKTRAPRGTDRSPEYKEHFCYKLDSRVKNLTMEWNQKQKHFITYASRSSLWICFVAVALQSAEEVFWKRGSPVTYFASPWICLWAYMANAS